MFFRALPAKKIGGVGSDESDEEGGGTNQTENGSGDGTGNANLVGIANPLPTDDQDPNDPNIDDEEAAARLRQMVHLSNSPLLVQAELSSSQNDFFKMLDEKINNGPDYDGACEYELALDHAQLCRFLQEWQAAKTRSRCQAPPAKLQRYHTLPSSAEPIMSNTGNVGHSHQMSSLQHQTSLGGIGSRQQLQAQQQHLQQQQQQATAQHKLHNPAAVVYQQMNPTIPTPSNAPYNNYQPQYDHYQSYRQYQIHHQQQQYQAAAAQYHAAQYQVANSVVLYDKSRGGYYTELA